MFIRILSAIAMGAFMLGGCAVIPINDEKPYQNKDLPGLVVGQSTRADVLLTLGTPRYVFDDEKLFIYAKTQLHTVWLMLVPGGFAGVTDATNHYLATAFDTKGRLTHMEAIPLSNDIAFGVGTNILGTSRNLNKTCFSTGVCFADAAGNTLYAAPNSDAKSVPPPDRCGLVLYRENKKSKNPSILCFNCFDPSSVAVGILLDRRPMGATNQDGYYRIFVSPGRHEAAGLGTLSTMSSASAEAIAMAGQFNDRLLIDCRAGETVFVRLTVPSINHGYIFQGKNWIRLETVPPDTAIKALATRKRLLPQWRAVNFAWTGRPR